MNYMRTHSLTSSLKVIASIAFAAVATFGAVAPANADPFDVANWAYGKAYNVPDFKFTKSEFGSTYNKQLLHLAIETGVVLLKGAKVVYHPATNEIWVYGYAGAGYSEPTQTRETIEACGPGHWFTQVVGGDIWCTPAHLVGNSGGTYLAGVIPGTVRECTFDAANDKKDVHKC
jgi:hypothetical protein